MLFVACDSYTYSHVFLSMNNISTINDSFFTFFSLRRWRCRLSKMLHFHLIRVIVCDDFLIRAVIYTLHSFTVDLLESLNWNLFNRRTWCTIKHTKCIQHGGIYGGTHWWYHHLFHHRNTQIKAQQHQRLVSKRNEAATNRDANDHLLKSFNDLHCNGS